MSLTREAAAALSDPIRQLVTRCRTMPRGKERNKLELELGEMLKRQDALILKLSVEPEPCPILPAENPKPTPTDAATNTSSPP